MSNKLEKKEIVNIFESIVKTYRQEIEETYDKRFPMLVNEIEKYAKNKISDIQFFVNSERNKLDLGSRKFYKGLEKCNDKKINWCIEGILDGSLYDAIDIACDRYTDMTRKFFNAVYNHITKNEIIDVYKEYTEEEIVEWYNESKYQQEHYSLEETLKDYVGKPKMSLEMFKTSQDIIDWYYNLQIIYRKMCKCDLNMIKDIEVK